MTYNPNNSGKSRVSYSLLDRILYGAVVTGGIVVLNVLGGCGDPSYNPDPDGGKPPIGDSQPKEDDGGIEGVLKPFDLNTFIPDPRKSGHKWTTGGDTASAPGYPRIPIRFKVPELADSTYKGPIEVRVYAENGAPGDVLIYPHPDRPWEAAIAKNARPGQTIEGHLDTLTGHDGKPLNTGALKIHFELKAGGKRYLVNADGSFTEAMALHTPSLAGGNISGKGFGGELRITKHNPATTTYSAKILDSDLETALGEIEFKEDEGAVYFASKKPVSFTPTTPARLYEIVFTATDTVTGDSDSIEIEFPYSQFTTSFSADYGSGKIDKTILPEHLARALGKHLGASFQVKQGENYDIAGAALSAAHSDILGWSRDVWDQLALFAGSKVASELETAAQNGTLKRLSFHF